MDKAFGYFFAFLFTIVMLVWVLAFIFGGVEILWWMFTGDFFHFVSVNTEAVSAF